MCVGRPWARGRRTAAIGHLLAHRRPVRSNWVAQALLSEDPIVRGPTGTRHVTPTHIAEGATTCPSSSFFWKAENSLRSPPNAPRTPHAHGPARLCRHFFHPPQPSSLQPPAAPTLRSPHSSPGAKGEQQRRPPTHRVHVSNRGIPARRALAPPLPRAEHVPAPLPVNLVPGGAPQIEQRFRGFRPQEVLARQWRERRPLMRRRRRRGRLRGERSSEKSRCDCT